MPETTPGLVRCPSCGAGNPTGSEWCGQCLYRFDRGERTTGAIEGTESRRPAVRRDGDALIWACPACEASNPVDADVCGTCGTTLAAAFGGRTARRPAGGVSPRAAFALSATLPGLGHAALGASGAALARAILYLWSLGVGLFLTIRPPESGRGLVRGIGVLFVLSGVAVWLLCMIETMRLAEGDDRPVVPRNALTWFSAALSGLLFFGLLAAALGGRS